MALSEVIGIVIISNNNTCLAYTVVQILKKCFSCIISVILKPPVCMVKKIMLCNVQVYLILYVSEAILFSREQIDVHSNWRYVCVHTCMHACAFKSVLALVTACIYLGKVFWKWFGKWLVCGHLTDFGSKARLKLTVFSLMP